MEVHRSSPYGVESKGRAGGNHYRHLFEHLPICILTVNVTTAVIADANQRACVVYGYSADEFVGIPVVQLVPEDLKGSAQAVLQRVRQGETVTHKTNNQRRDGTIFPVRVVASLDPANRGQMIIAARDITAESFRRTETEAIEAERVRIAHEIHDGVAQNLAALRLKAAMWQSMAGDAEPEIRFALKELQDVLSDSIADIRRAIFALRPVDLDAVGFFPAISQMVKEFGDQYLVLTDVIISGTQDALPVSYEQPLFRVIQHGLINIRQHSLANSVVLRLTSDAARGVTLSLRDNGRGFDPSVVGTKAGEGHFGLRQMRERILQRGGTMDILSTIGLGTELFITLPPLTNGPEGASSENSNRG